MPGFLQSVFGGSSKNDDDQNHNQNANQNNQNNQNQSSGQNNQQTNVDLPENIWETKPDSTQNNQQQQNQQQNQQQQVDPETALKNHIDSLNLTSGIDLAKIQEDIRTGSVESINAAFDQIAGNTYKAAISQMNNIMDSKIASVREEVTRDASANINKDMAIREMNNKLPFTTDVNIAPVANAVLNQFLSKGHDLNTSITKAAAYFKSVGEKVNVASKTPGSRPGDNRFNEGNNSHNNNSSSPASHDEWLDILAQR